MPALKVIEKKVKNGIIKTHVILENVNPTTGAALNWVRLKDNQIEIPTAMLADIIVTLAQPETRTTVNRLLRAYCDGLEYDISAKRKGVSVVQKVKDDIGSNRKKDETLEK